MASPSSSSTPSQAPESPFSLLVTLRFASLDDKNDFLSLIRPLAQYIQQHEPDTLQYQVLLSDKDELQVLVLERYKNKENAYLKVHRSSEAFLAFRPKLHAMQEAGKVMSVTGHSYLDCNIGFDGR